jgi:ribosome-binding factor A
MAGARIERINEQVMKILAELLRDIKDPRVNSGAMLSILRCETTNDLRYAKVYLSALGEVDKKRLMSGLEAASGFLRRELGARLTLRYTPELKFILDDSIARSVSISKMLRDIEVKANENDDQADG